MSKSIFVSICLLALFSCTGKKENELISIDVTTKYPKKELIIQDFAEVEYVRLETTKENLITHPIYIDDKKIVGLNMQTGNIVFFNNEGKFVNSFKHKGNGPQEYTSVLPSGIILDNGEVMVYDMQRKRVQIYDEKGVYKRTLNMPNGEMYTDINIFNSENFICYDESLEGMIPYTLVSRKDGSVSKKIDVKFEKRMSMYFLIYGDNNQVTGAVSTPHYPIESHMDEFILNEASSDTIYKFDSKERLIPFIVRKPMVQTMSKPISLYALLETKEYIFMVSVEKYFDMKTHEGFANVDLVYDKDQSDIYEYSIKNREYDTEKNLRLPYIKFLSHNNGFIRYNAINLCDDLENGLLSGKLKEIASSLNEDDNPVIARVKFR